jgi:ATP-binding protein involved in chromosome partitioning
MRIWTKNSKNQKGFALMKPPASLVGVRHVLGVVSGKGGVGKSTVAANLAIAFGGLGKQVGLLDADIYGPSLPSIMNLRGLPALEGKKMLPLQNHGVKVMSMGFVIPSDASPAVWRGPMASSALGQLISNTAWGELDVLVVDLPPGTGDVHLTLTQSVAMSGCVVVSTPHDMALVSAIKGLNMFKKVGVPVLGIVENMAYYQCETCKTPKYIFGEKKARMRAAELGVPFLAEIPIVASEDPIVIAAPKSATAIVYANLASDLWKTMESASVNEIKILD